MRAGGWRPFLVLTHFRPDLFPGFASTPSGSPRARNVRALTAGLDTFRSRTELALKVAVWGVGLALTLLLAGGGALGTAIWYAAKPDSRVERVEKAVGAAEKRSTARR